MKLRIVLIILFAQFSVLFGQTNSLNSRISISYTGNDFAKILKLFEQKTDCYFQYDASLKPKKKRFVVNYQNEIAKVALRDFLQGLGLNFILLGDNFLVLQQWEAPNDELVISGRVWHSESKERLVNAMVSLVDRNQTTFTNDQGIFQFKTSSGKLIYAVSYPGFETFYDTIDDEKRNYFIDIPLVPDNSESMEITLVTADGNKNTPKVVSGKSDEFNINRAQLDKIPHLMGEPDILRVMSLNPGVVSGSEGVFGMYVRGGASDQNLILLDEVPVYNAYHLYGMFGVFNSDVVKNAKFYRGVFPADKGGRLSSVIDVTTKEGNAEKFGGSVSIGLLSSRLSLNGPIFKKKTSFSMALRRSFFDYLVQPLSSLVQFQNGNFANRYYFYDVNFKITHRFSERSRLSASGYLGIDYAGLLDRNTTYKNNNITQDLKLDDVSSWGNQLASIKWDYMLTPSATFSLKAYVTNYLYAHSHLYSNQQIDLFGNQKLEKSLYVLSNGLRDIEYSAHLKKQVTHKLAAKIGLGYILHTFIPNKRVITSETDSVKMDIVFEDNLLTTPEIFSYLTLEYHNPKWGYYDFGIRGVYYGLGYGQYYILPEPRISIRYALPGDLWLKMAASQTRQFFHQLNNLTMGLPSDLWVPSNTIFKPAKATQGSIGLTKELENFQFSAEVFQKVFNDILEYNNSAVYVTSGQNWENSVCAGNGLTKGIEILAEKTKGNLTGWISYTWMTSTRQFSQLNQGNAFPSRYDRRHNIYIMASYKLSKRINISATWVFNSGFAYTMPIGVYPSTTNNDPYRDIYIYGDRNDNRARDNHRLDLSMTISSKTTKYPRNLSFGIYNVYNRHNPFFLNLGIDSDGARKLYQVSLLPIIPFASYQISF